MIEDLVLKAMLWGLGAGVFAATAILTQKTITGIVALLKAKQQQELWERKDPTFTDVNSMFETTSHGDNFVPVKIQLEVVSKEPVTDDTKCTSVVQPSDTVTVSTEPVVNTAMEAAFKEALNVRKDVNAFKDVKI